MKEVNIKTKLIFFYGDQFALFRRLAVYAMHLAYGKDSMDRGNVSDLLLALIKNMRNMDLQIDYSEPTAKHNKTTLFYFSEEEHKVFTKYFDDYFPKGLSQKQKKIATTRIIIRLLCYYIITKMGEGAILKIKKRVIKEKQNGSTK